MLFPKAYTWRFRRVGLTKFRRLFNFRHRTLMLWPVLFDRGPRVRGTRSYNQDACAIWFELALRLCANNRSCAQ